MRWRAVGSCRRRRRAATCLALLALAVLGPLPADASSALSPQLDSAAAPVAQLVPIGSERLPGGTTIYRYEQRARGVPVLGAQAIVADSPGIAPELSVDSTIAGIAAPTPPRVPRGFAVAVAQRVAGVKRLAAQPAAELAVAPEGHGKLVWVVTLPSTRPLADYRVLVSATTGRVLETRDRLMEFQTGQAKLYDPNPVVEQGSYTGLGADHADGNTALLTGLRLAVALPRLSDGQSCLVGRWAKAVMHLTRDPVCSASLDWTGIKRSSDRFEALMAYYHVDRAEAYIQSLGFTNIQNRRQVLLADATTQDNSFYRPSDRTITYGSGGVDDAEDADVILHEYGHSIQDDQVTGFGLSFAAGSMGEGFGDYWAAAMSSRSPGPPANEWNVCIFDWDGVSYITGTPHCGRRADSTMTRQQAQSTNGCRSDVHCVGTVWSSALWDLRLALGNDGQGRSVMDRVVLASHFRLTPVASFANGADALQEADEDLYPAGPDDGEGLHYAAIHAEMLARGLL